MGKTFSRPRSNPIEYRPPPPPPEDLNVKCREDVNKPSKELKNWYDTKIYVVAKSNANTRKAQDASQNIIDASLALTRITDDYNTKLSALGKQAIRNIYNSFTEGTYDAKTFNQYISVYTENLNLKKKIDSLNEKNTQNMQNINFTLVNYTLLQKMNYYSFIFYYIMVLFFIWVLWMNKPFSLLPTIFIIILFLFLPFLLDYIEQYLFLLYKYILYMLVLDRRETTIIHNYVPDNLEYVYNPT
jgi:hypothetical protein